MRQASTRFHRSRGERAGAPNRRPEERGFALIADAGSLDIFVEEVFQLVMCRHLVAPAAFLMQPDPPALAIGKVVLTRMDTTAPMRAKA